MHAFPGIAASRSGGRREAPAERAAAPTRRTKIRECSRPPCIFRVRVPPRDVVRPTGPHRSYSMPFRPSWRHWPGGLRKLLLIEESPDALPALPVPQLRYLPASTAANVKSAATSASAECFAASAKAVCIRAQR